MIRTVLIGCISLFLFSRCANEAERNRGELLEITEKLNEKCPAMLDSETRLEGMGVKEPNTLVYNYTLVNLLAENVDTVLFYRAVWPGIISNIKVSPEMKRIRETNTTIEYAYRDKNNKPIYTVKIYPSDYK